MSSALGTSRRRFRTLSPGTASALAALLLLMAAPADAAGPRRTAAPKRAAAPARTPAPAPTPTLGAGGLTQVLIEGNKRVEDEAIRIHLRSREGGRFSEADVDADVRALYAMGFFDQIEADLTSTDGYNILTYRVTERPFIRELRIEGNDELDKDELEQALKVRPNTIYNPQKVQQGIDDARKEYAKKGYLDATITPVLAPIEGTDNESRLTFQVSEGKLIRIKHIVFEGNRAFSDSKLEGYMQTKEAWFLSFLTGAGNLDNEALDADVERLTAFYYDNGYIDVRIDKPQVERIDDGLQITIKIDEGEQYTTGAVRLSGDPLPDMARAEEALTLKEGEVFRSSKLRADITAVTEVYGDDGYAFVNVTPDTAVDQTAKKVDVTYNVSKGPIVFIDTIQISGNTKTRDKVIRRELELEEQQRFSGAKLRRSQERLQRLGFFSDVNITTKKSDEEDRLDMIVDVKETSTGAFSAGAGIASGENFLFNIRLSELNLFGRGQRIVLNADFGSIRRNFTLDFTEPYLFDTQISAGFSVFNWQLQFDEFTRGGTGGNIRMLYPLTGFGWESIGPFSLNDAKVGLEYRLELAEISNVDRNAATVIRAEQGKSLTSSFTPRFLRDTRNHPLAPTKGSVQDFSIEIAGVGGESQFIKAEGRIRWYIPIWSPEWLGTFILSPGGNIGYGYGYGSSMRELPLFERYFPGGINSLRGYQILSLGPNNIVTNAAGQKVHRDPIGGSNQLITNDELIFPIVESLGLRGVVFFDAGNAFRVTDAYNIDDFRMATGAGVRWMSPIGPLRIEYGIPLNEKHGDQIQHVMFSFGGFL